MRSRHREVIVRHGRRRAAIDEAIAPLVLEVWKARVRTDHSCQDARRPGDKQPWITLGFTSVADARRWMRIVARPKKNLRWLHNQEKQRACRRMRQLGIACWRWEAYAYDAVYPAVGPTRLDLGVFVSFPRSDLTEVLRGLRSYNRRRGATR